MYYQLHVNGVVSLSIDINVLWKIFIIFWRWNNGNMSAINAADSSRKMMFDPESVTIQKDLMESMFIFHYAM